MSNEFEKLERRQLLAYDLYISALTTTTPYVTAGDTFSGSIAILNKEGKPIRGTPSVKVFLTKNFTVGDVDDVIIEQFQFDTSLHSPSKRFETTIAATVPNGNLGRYVLAATVTAAGELITDVNRLNDTLLTTTPVTIYTGAWPSSSIIGTAGNDSIVIGASQGTPRPIVTVNGETHVVPDGNFFIDGGPGADKIVAESNVNFNLAITGSGGNDTIIGGSGSDQLSGAFGRDRIFGGPGNDYLLGGANNDSLVGDAGNDTLSAAGGNDRLVDNSGNNYFLGGGGNDLFQCRSPDGFVGHDTISGGPGSDTAQRDPDDVKSSIEFDLP